LAATEALAQQVIVPAIATRRQVHPDLQVDLVASVRSLDIARREADVAVRFARPTASDLVCRKLGEIGFSLYASLRYLAKYGTPKRGQGLAGYDLITFTGVPSAISPFFMGESLEGARVARVAIIRLSSLRLRRARWAAELACFIGDASPDVVRMWPNESPALRPVWLIVHQDLRRSARIKVVSSAIADAFRHQSGVLRNRSQARH
jgi:DNA-binding transcriptional LysR family regulator